MTRNAASRTPEERALASGYEKLQQDPADVPINLKHEDNGTRTSMKKTIEIPQATTPDSPVLRATIIPQNALYRVLDIVEDISAKVDILTAQTEANEAKQKEDMQAVNDYMKAIYEKSRRGRNLTLKRYKSLKELMESMSGTVSCMHTEIKPGEDDEGELSLTERLDRIDEQLEGLYGDMTVGELGEKVSEMAKMLKRLQENGKEEDDANATMGE